MGVGYGKPEREGGESEMSLRPAPGQWLWSSGQQGPGLLSPDGTQM